MTGFIGGGGLPLLGKVPEEAFVAAEVQAGVRCQACGARLDGAGGFDFVTIAAVQSDRGPVVRGQGIRVCRGVDGCRAHVELVELSECVAVREVAPFTFLDAVRAEAELYAPTPKKGGADAGSD